MTVQQQIEDLKRTIRAFACMIANAAVPEDGKSAYQIAIEHGFQGTEQEWLDSLKGEGGNENLQQVSNNGNATSNPIVVQGIIQSASVPKTISTLSDTTFVNKEVRDLVMHGHNVFKNLNPPFDPSNSTFNTRYVGVGSVIFPQFTGDSTYRPGHNAHDSWVGVGSNLGFGVEDGTNITLLGTTLFYRNDIKIWDSVTAIGKGHTNARPPFNDPERVAISVDGFNMRDMMASVFVAGNEHWVGDIHSSTIVGCDTKVWKYIFNSIVLGVSNQSYNPNNDTKHANNFLDNDIIIGNGLWKNLDRYEDSYNLIIGSQSHYGIGNWNKDYIPLIEGNFRNPFLRVNGRFEINDAYTKIITGNDGSLLSNVSYKVDGPLRDRTYVSGKKNLNANLFVHPQTVFGSFIVSGVNNFPILASDNSTTDEIDAITVYGQRNGVFHKEGFNVWSFGTAGHINNSNPFRNVFNLGVLGVGRGLTAPTTPTTPTSGKVLKYNEDCINIGSNQVSFVNNSVTVGTGNSNMRMLTESVIIGNSNYLTTPNTEDVDSSIIIGHGMLTSSMVTGPEKAYNFRVGINGRLFLEGYYGDTGEKYTSLKGKVLLEERLRLKSYTKAERNALPNPVAGEIIMQTDATNKGLRFFDGANWLAISTTVD